MLNTLKLHVPFPDRFLPTSRPKHIRMAEIGDNKISTGSEKELPASPVIRQESIFKMVDAGLNSYPVQEAINRVMLVMGDRKNAYTSGNKGNDEKNEEKDTFDITDFAKLSIVEHVFDFVDRDSSGELTLSELNVGIEALLPTVRTPAKHKSGEFIEDDDEKGPPGKSGVKGFELRDLKKSPKKVIEFTQIQDGKEVKCSIKVDLDSWNKIQKLKKYLDEDDSEGGFRFFRSSRTKANKDSISLVDLRVEYGEAIQYLMNVCGIPTNNSPQTRKFYLLLLEYLKTNSPQTRKFYLLLLEYLKTLEGYHAKYKQR
ncbi:hypothetical protein AAMO2058_001194000 [Amorphochlora amoebiformis]